MTSRILFGFATSLLLLLSGCKDPTEAGTGGTSGTALYAFDSTTSTVLVWKDISTLYDSTTPPEPIKISSSFFSKVTSLAWGGLCVDSQRGLLYLVSETGDIVRVNRIRNQSGAVTNVDVYSFQLNNSAPLTNGKFGQASLDSQSDTLLITENGDNGTRIWTVSGASSIAQNASVSLQALQLAGDKGGTGVAAYSGVVYAFMTDGNPVGIDSVIGPRLRKGTTTTFDPAIVLMGSNTELGVYGSLALDTGNGYLFVARHNTASGLTTKPILAFRTGQFPPGGGINQLPTLTLGSATGQADLRVLSHARTKDWLVGLRGLLGVGFGTIYVWKSPLTSTDAKVITVTPSGSVLKGVAVDGNAS